MTHEPTSVRVEVHRWSSGWELHILGSADLITQTESGWDSFDDAERQTRDYLETVFDGADFSRVSFEFVEKSDAR